MDYLLKRFYIYQELQKIKTGAFSFTSTEDRLRARFLLEIDEIHRQIQHRGVLFGLCLIFTAGYPLSLFQKISVLLICRETSTYFYIDEILSVLELDKYS
jgi:hypothetical protein